MITINIIIFIYSKVSDLFEHSNAYDLNRDNPTLFTESLFIHITYERLLNS